MVSIYNLRHRTLAIKNNAQSKQSSESDYQKRLTKLRESQERQREKQQQKLQDPECREKLQLKQLEAANRTIEKQRERQSCPEYREKQLTKAREAQVRSRERLIEKGKGKENNPKPQSKKLKMTKSKGLLGRARTAVEKKLESKISGIGCICCHNQGWPSVAPEDAIYYISMHHVEGRTKPWSHAKQLPLCQHHHDTPPPHGAPTELFPLHGLTGGKKRWQDVNGTQEELLIQVYELIDEERPWIKETLS
jgi:hypothetical protein